MAISFVNDAVGGSATTTSFSIILPATQAGDIIILEFAHRASGDGTLGGTYSGPAFTLKHSQTFGSSFSGKLYWSRAIGDHAGETVTCSGLTNSCAAGVTVYRGAKSSGDPLNAATLVAEANASGDETQAEIVTTVNGAWVVLTVVNSPDFSLTNQTCTSPGSLTQRMQRSSTGGTDTSVEHASAEKIEAGATGSFTWSQTNSASGSWAYAIEPEPTSTNLIIQGCIHVQRADGAEAVLAENQVGNNYETIAPLLNSISQCGTRFVGNGQKLLRFEVVLQQDGNVTDNVFAVLYAENGSGIPVTPVLATSAAVSGQTIGLGDTSISFDFSGENFTLGNGTVYVVLVEWTDSQSTFGQLFIKIQLTDVLAGAFKVTGDGSTWNSDATDDLTFAIYTDGGLTLQEEAGGDPTLANLNVSHAHTADNLALTQVHSLAVNNSQHEHLTDSPSLTQVHILTVANVQHDQLTDNVILAQVHVLTLQNAIHSHLSDNLALTQAHVLSMQDASHANSVDNVAISQTHILAVQGSTHDHLADNLDLTTALIIANAQHDQTAGNMDIVQQHALVLANAQHAHVADQVDIDTEATLTINSAQHSHTPDNVVLTQIHILQVAEAIHSHSVENLAITQQHILALANAIHAHTADGLTLDVFVTLDVGSALQEHSVDNLSLTQIHELVIQASQHSHLADSLTFSQESTLVITNAIHALLADSTNLIENVQLSISDGIHEHSAESMSIGQVHVLQVSDALFDHLADLVNITVGIYKLEPDRILVLRSENRVLVIQATHNACVLDELNRSLALDEAHLALVKSTEHRSLVMEEL